MYSKSPNGDIVYTINCANTNSANELYLSFSSTNLGEILEKGSDYDVSVKKVRFPVTSIPLRSRFADSIYTLYECWYSCNRFYSTFA